MPNRAQRQRQRQRQRQQHTQTSLTHAHVNIEETQEEKKEGHTHAQNIHTKTCLPDGNPGGTQNPRGMQADGGRGSTPGTWDPGGQIFNLSTLNARTEGPSSLTCSRQTKQAMMLQIRAAHSMPQRPLLLTCMYVMQIWATCAQKPERTLLKARSMCCKFG